MIRPMKMSLITMNFNKVYSSRIIKELIDFKEIHLKRQIDFSSKDGKAESRKNLENKYILSFESFEKIEKQIETIQDSLSSIIKQAKLIIGKNKSVNNNKKICLDFDNIEDLFSEITIQIEDITFNFKKMARKIDISNQILERIAIIASFINLLKRYGAEHYFGAKFKHLTYSLFTTSIDHYVTIQAALEELKAPIVFKGDKISEDLIGIFVFYDLEYEKKISELFLNYNCQKIVIPEKYYDNNGFHMDRLKKDHDLELNTKTKYQQEYSEFVKNLPILIESYIEAFENAIQILYIIQNIEKTSSMNIYKIEGFIPTDKETNFITKLKEKYGPNVKIDIKRIERHNPYEEEENEDNKSQDKSKSKEIEDKKHTLPKEVPPTYMKFGKIGNVFSSLLEMYGTTNYSEIDPSFIMFFTFPIIFGLMFGDFGHGFILIIVGFAIWLKLRKLDSGTKRLGLVLLYSGIGAMFCGLLYGESFGEELIVFGQHIILFVRPVDNITTVLKLSILVGVMLIIFGWVMKFINLFINNRKFLAFSDPLIKIIMMIGGTYLIFTYYFDIEKWLAPPEPILLVVIPSIIYCFIRPLGKAMKCSYLKDKKASSLISESIMDWGETMLQIVSNVASFMRILALEMAHIGLSLVFNEISNVFESGGGLFGKIVSIMIMIIGTIFIIALETLLVMIHGLRLHFYEFFSKFYVAGGIKFKPIAFKENLCTFNFKMNLE